MSILLRYAIKFGHLTKEFVQRSEFLRPCLDNGDRVMALWFKDNKYLPATIEEDEKHTYSIRFDGRKNSFKGQRPDTVYRLEEFEVDDEVMLNTLFFLFLPENKDLGFCFSLLPRKS